MARLFDDATPDFLEADIATFTAAPFTISAWFRSDDLSDTLVKVLYFCGDKDVEDEHWDVGMEEAAKSNTIQLRAKTASSSSQASTTTSPSINTWHHACTVAASATDRAAFIDGGSKGISVTNRIPAGADRTSIGRRGDSTPTREWSGDIAHVAVWNVALTDDEVATLAEGISPLRVRRDALIAYWPIGGQSAEPDIVGGLNLTVNGTPAKSEEPPIPYSIIAPG